MRRAGDHKLGTFAGVFTPSILTILGIILFLRTGYLVGRTGLLVSLLIIVASSVIALLTAMSLSAIATNMRVKGGGDYYLISRTLGVEYGGAIGIVLFLAQTISVAFYCYGFGEAAALLLPESPWVSPRSVAATLLVLLFGFALAGADWASRLQTVIMVVLAAALMSFFAGGIQAWDTATLRANLAAPADAMPFWAAFALFFPAVTGFTQGVAMSGDLKHPGRSLPTGTFAAIGLSTLVYLAAATLLAAALPAGSLAADYGAMNEVAAIALLISAGVLAATASSGMASFMAGPRILQALAADRVFPPLTMFSEGARRDNNPRRAVVLAGAVAMAFVWLGDLNAIAPVVAMFFLISYGLLNYATWFEGHAQSPQFRPAFRYFNKYLSLVGAAGCLVAMLAIEPGSAALSIAILFGIHQYVQRTAGKQQWADSQRAYNFQRIRELLFEMKQDAESARDWRPQILALSGGRERRRHLLSFGSWIEGNSGITSVVSIVAEDDEDDRRDPSDVRERIAAEIEELGIDAFPLVIRAPSFRTGLEILLQAYGVGPIHANIVLLNWLEEAPGKDREAGERVFGRNMREALRLGCNIVALSASDETIERLETRDSGDRRIDIWWAGSATGRLSLILGYLMTRTAGWRDAVIRIHAQGSNDHPGRTVDRLQEVLEDVRIDAEINVIEDTPDADTLLEHSADASVVFVPMRLDGDRPTDFLDEPIRGLQDESVAVALVIAGEDIDLDEDPEEGGSG